MASGAKRGIFVAKPTFALYCRRIGGLAGKDVPFVTKKAPLVTKKAPSKEHRFRIGQSVYFTSRPIGHMIANSTYEIVRLLPSDGTDYQYRIKNPKEAFERVARESQLENSY